MYCLKCGGDLPEGSKFCNHCGTTLGSTVGGGAKKIRVGVLIALLATVSGLFLYSVTIGRRRGEEENNRFMRELVNNPTYIPVTEYLVNGTVNVPARRVYEVRVIIDAVKMRNARVTGRFATTGGSGNDVAAIFAREDDYINWKNGHQSRPLYLTEKITTDTFDVRVPMSGVYYLAFSNTFSTISDKTVDAKVQLSYEKPDR